MGDSPTVLLVTASFGNGHNQVASTLKQEFESKGVSSVHVVDMFRESFPVVNKTVQFLYKKSYMVGKRIYKMFYYKTDSLSSKNRFGWYMQLGIKTVQEKINELKPDIVIMTFPVAAISEFRKQSSHPFQLYTVVTDYCLHHAWMHENVDHYFVATNEIKQKMMSSHVKEDQISVFGIPIRKEFLQESESNQVKEDMNLKEDRKTVLLVAGADGVIRNIPDFAKKLLESSPDTQLLIVCGRNRSLYESLEPLATMYQNRFRLFGYVTDIHRLYAAADVLITKPGGITLSEAIAMKLPTILYRPVPGQEEENSRYFYEKGACVVVQEKERLVSQTIDLLKNTNQLSNMEHALEDMHYGNSAASIVTYTLSKQ